MSDGAADREASRSHRWLAIAALTGAAALVAWGLTADHGSPSPACDAGDPIDTVYDAQAAQQIRDAFASTSVSHAPTVAATVVRDLDAWAADFTTARGSVCEVGDEAASRVACLHRQRRQFGAFVDVLRQATAANVEHAGLVATVLPPLEDCGRPILGTGAAELDGLQARVMLGDPDAALDELAAHLDASAEGPDPDRARALLLLGQAHARAQRWPEAATRLERALWACIEVGRDDWAIDAALALATATQQTATTGSIPEAQRWWRLASALTTKLGPGLERQRRLLATQGALLLQQGEWDAALAVYEPALSLTEKRYGAEHPALVAGLLAVAEVAARTGRAPQSLGIYDRARTIVASTLGRHHPLHRALAQRHGSVLLEVDRPDLARAELEASLEGLDDAGVLVGVPEVEAALDLGQAAAALQEPAEAERAFARAEALHARAGLPPGRLLPAIHLGRGLVHLERNDARAAIESFRAALDLQREAEGERSPVVAQTSVRIGRAFARLGRMDEAREALATAADIASDVYGPDDPRTAEIWLAQSEVDADRGDPQAALDLARAALSVLAETRGAQDVSTLVALTQVGSTCLALGRDADAVAAFEQAVAVARAAGDDGHLASAQLGLATALWKRGSKDAALAVVTELRGLVEASGEASPVTADDLASWMERRGVSM